MPSVVHVATPRNKKSPPPAVKQRREATSLRKFISFTRGIPDRKMAQWVRVTKVSKLRGPDNRILLRCETITEKPNTPPERGHYCSFMPADPSYKGKISECPALMFDCNCVTGDTKVLTDKGWKAVQDIAEPRLPNHFPLNYLVNGKSYSGSAPFHKGRQKVWEVCLDNGRKLTLTKKHKLRQYHGRKHTPQFGYVDGVRQYLGYNTHKDILSWTRLKDLSIGDKLLLDTFDPIEYKIKQKDFNEAFFIGVLMGDGTLYNTGQPCLELYKNTLTRRQDIIEGLRFSDVVAGDWDNNNGGTHISFTNRAKELMNRYRFVNKQSVKLRNFSQLMGYLSGLIITDGSVSVDNVAICGGKKYLAPLINKLARYGFSEVSFIKVKHKGEITNYGERKSDLWRLSLGSKVLRKIEKYLRVAREQHTAIGRICAKKASTGLYYAKIISIAYKGIQDVYDISVNKIHRFNANGIITKNCHRWLFVWEFAMWYRGAARLLRSNGDFPEQTNSLLRPGGCKHTIVGAEEILRKKL